MLNATGWRTAIKASLLAAPLLVFSFGLAGCDGFQGDGSPSSSVASSTGGDAVASSTAASMEAFHQELRAAGYTFTSEEQAAIDEAAPKTCGMASFLHAPDSLLVENLPNYMRTHHDVEIGADAARTVWQAAKKHICGKVSGH